MSDNGHGDNHVAILDELCDTMRGFSAQMITASRPNHWDKCVAAVEAIAFRAGEHDKALAVAAKTLESWNETIRKHEVANAQIAALREVVERYERASISYHEAAVKPERWVAWCARKGTAGFYEGTQHNSEHAARKHIRESANITPDLLRRAGLEGGNDGHTIAADD